MCAQFHPKEDLVVSAALDQTIRVWDISGLRKKNAAPTSMTFEEQMQRANSSQADLFGSTDAIVKYVLEGHDRGVNWVTFHPTLPLIVSSGDDRQVKLWRMNDTKAWEVDTCRGHFNNVCCALFHPRQELIISAAEDKTIRVWDMTKRTAVQTFRREHDRFWMLTAHPELNLFAAGHDNGLIVFKLERERPAYSLHQNQLFYVKEKILRVHDFSNNSDQSVLSVKRLGNQYTQPRTLSYNPAERAVLLTSTADGGIYELYTLPRDFTGEPRDPGSDGKRGSGTSAIFIARNRFAVLDKARQQIEIRDLSNAVTKTIKPPATVNDIFYGGTGSLLLSTPTSVILYDIQQRQTLSEITTPPVKYIVWSTDMQLVALLSKHTITICNKTLEQSSLIHETIRIKSGAWDDAGIFVYSTLNHIKYALPQGDNGIIKTLEQPIYLTRVKGKTVHCLDRDGKARSIPIDPTEYRFKLALVKRNYEEVLHIIQTSNLVGQSIIAYLQKKGYPEIALHFVQDQKTRFDLAIECGNLDVAIETAKALDREDCWKMLAAEALRQGHHKAVEMAYQRIKNFEKLSFLYLITGNEDNLQRMLKIAEHRGDTMSRFHNALFLGDVADRVNILREVGLAPLAYMTAKTNGLEDEAEAILAESGLTAEDVVDVPIDGESLTPPKPVHITSDTNWPTLPVAQNFFDAALAGNMLAQAPKEIAEQTNGVDAMGDWGGDDDLGFDGNVAADEAEEGDGWDMDADLKEQLEAEGAIEADVGGPGEDVAGMNESELWTRNSPLAADHVAAGSFESAMQLLNRQIGVVNFAPLKSLFLSAYQASRTSLAANASVSSLPLHVRRGEEYEARRVLPVLRRDLQSILNGELQSAYRDTKGGKFPDAIKLFKSILLELALMVTTTPEEAEELKQLVGICREYLIGLSMEVERRAVANDDVKRSLELAAYFTHCQLDPAHLQLALRSAMTVHYKVKNYASASTFARRLLELNPPVNAANQARQIQTVSDRNPRDEITIDYDEFSEFKICAASFTPIYAGQGSSIACPYCAASYLEEHKGSVCKVCELGGVGATASGLRSQV